jgi:MoaA/NifB/PqqE/SkfB family radical SAM enzyme
MISLKNLKNKIAKKIDRYFFQRIRRRLTAKLSYFLKFSRLGYPPEYLQIDICGFCNLACEMCPQGEAGTVKEKGMMDFGLFKEMVDKAKGAGIFSVLLVMTGEPLMHPQFIEMVKYAKSKELKVQSSTNCTLLTREKAREIIESGLDEIILSFDTMDKASYENFRKGAKFEEVFSNIINFLELRKELRSNKPLVVMQNLQPYPRTKNPRPQIEKNFLAAFSKYDNIWIMPKYFCDWSGIMHNTRDFSYVDNTKKFQGKYRLCEAIYHRLVVSWDGKALACCNDFLRAQVVGDLCRQSVMEAWNSPAFVDLRKKLIAKEYARLPLCKSCGLLWEAPGVE